MADNDSTIADTLAPVFLELGKAVYVCQIYESSLRLLISMLKFEASDGQDSAFDEAWSFHSNKPLKRVLEGLSKLIDVPPQLAAYLQEAVDIRNFLVHESMAKNAERLSEPKGRLEVEQELAGMKDEVRKRDAAVNKLLDALWKKYGTSNEALKQRADERWEYLNPARPENDDALH